MAIGFKVADAFVDVHVEDGTKRGRDDIDRRMDKWSKDRGDKDGNNWAKSFGRAMVRGFRPLFSAILKTALYSTIVGVIGSAVSALAGYIVQAFVAIVNLLVVLGHALQIFALLPGVIFAAVTALLSLKLAFSGVGEALKAGWQGDMAKFNEALKKLSPNAQAAVREIVKLKPAIDGLKKSLQDAVFADLAGLIKTMAADFLPGLTVGLVAVGTGLNHIIKGIFAGLLAGLPSLMSALQSVGQIFQDIGAGLTPLIAGLAHFLDISLKVMNVGRVDEILANIGAALSRLTSDDIKRWVDNSIEALKLLGRLVGDIIGIFGGLANAASGSSMFTWLDRINAWVQQNQPLLHDFFAALEAAANAMSPVLYELMRQLTALLTAFGPVMQVIGPVLTMLLHSLGDALIALMPSLTPLLVAIGKLAISAIPALVPLLQILMDMATAMAPGIGVFLEALARVIKPLVPLAPVLGKALGDMFAALGPLLEALGPIAVMAIQALVILLQQMAQILPVLIENLAQIDIAGMIEAIMPYLPDLVSSVISLLYALVKLTVALAPIITEFLILLTPALLPVLTFMLNLLAGIIKAVADALGWLTSGLDGSFQGLQKIIDKLNEWWHKLTDIGSNAKGKIKGWFDGAKNWLYDTGKDMIQGLIDGATNLLGKIGGFLLAKLPGWLVDPFKAALGISSPSKVFKQIGVDTIAGYIQGVQSQTGRLQNVLTGIAMGLPDQMSVSMRAAVASIPAPTIPKPDLYAYVQIGDKPVRDMVRAEVEENPELVARAADEGHRTNAFTTDPSRKRVGVS